MRKTALLERFEEKYEGEPTSGCWIWLAATNKKGYGLIQIERRFTRAHRVSWRIFRGAIPTGLAVLHRCDVRSCVNPSHLFLGTTADNNRDMVQKGRHGNSQKTECLRGHPFTADNTLFDSAGGRECRECGNLRRRVGWRKDN